MRASDAGGQFGHEFGLCREARVLLGSGRGVLCVALGWLCFWPSLLKVFNKFVRKSYFKSLIVQCICEKKLFCSKKFHYCFGHRGGHGDWGRGLRLRRPPHLRSTAPLRSHWGFARPTRALHVSLVSPILHRISFLRRFRFFWSQGRS